MSGAVRAVFSVTLLSRLGGLARDVLVGRLFGDTALGSAFSAAFAIPNTFRRLFGEGALSAAFIPVYAGFVKNGEREQSDRLASMTLAALATVTGVLTAVIEVVLLGLVLWLPGDAERVLSLQLVMVMLPFMPLICVVALLAGMLQVHGRFAASSTGPLVLNTFIIVVALFFVATGRAASPMVAYVIGAATVLSGLTQAVWFRWLLKREFAFRRDVGPAKAAGFEMLRRFGPVVLGLGTLQISALIDTLIAMWPIWIGPRVLGYDYPLDERSNVILAMMQRLYQFPLGVFGIAVATAIFPLLSKAADEPERFVEMLRRGLRLSLFIGLPATVGLILVRGDIVTVFYGGSGTRGFSAEGLARGAEVLTGYAAAIWAYSLNHVLTRAFYAKGDTATPTKLAVVMVLGNLLGSLTLIWWMREAGMAWATAGAATVQCVALVVLLSRRLGTAVVDRGVMVAAGRIVVMTGLMAGVCAGVGWWMPMGGSWRGHLMALLAVGGVGISAYSGAAWALGAPELWWLVGRGRSG